MTIASFDSFIAFKSSVEIDFPFSSFSSSLKAKLPFCFKAAHKWSVKPLRVSLPLKLRNTSYVNPGVEDDEDEAILVRMEAIKNIQIKREPQLIRQKCIHLKMKNKLEGRERNKRVGQEREK